MNKEVLLSLRGLQYEIGDDHSQPLETITPAEYYHRDGHHYIVYDEIIGEGVPPIKNRIKFRGDYLEVNKNGPFSVNMIFEEKKKNITNYNTPYGEIVIGVDTDKVKMTEEEQRIKLEVEYSLDVNYMHMAECQISVDVRDRIDGLPLS